MKTAIAILATGEYHVGARVMFYTLRKYGALPADIDCYAVGMNRCDFAEPYPIDDDYSWVPVNQTHFPRVADKFAALRLPYDRIVMMDADMICVGDCSYLWSQAIGALGFYACRDTASNIYYEDRIRDIGLDPAHLFNAGTMVFQMDRLDVGSDGDFYNDMLYGIRAGLPAYDGGDQGYLNAYFQLLRPWEIGVLPAEYNESYDPNMPSLPDHAQRIIHFTGRNANPWAPRLRDNDPRNKWVKRWRSEYETCQ